MSIKKIHDDQPKKFLFSDENLKKVIEEMKVHEKEHCDFFEKELVVVRVECFILLP